MVTYIVIQCAALLVQYLFFKKLYQFVMQLLVYTVHLLYTAK